MIENRILNLKTNLLKSSVEAAKLGNTKELVSLSKYLEEVDKADENLIEINYKIDFIESRLTNLDKDYDHITSPKAMGKKRREELTNHLNKLGIKLFYLKGIKYTLNDSLIGIATASNKFSNKKWFLGLPNDTYISIILICEIEKNKNINFILPNNIFKKIKGNLSKDRKGNQLKFNIKKEGSNYFLVVPNISDINIDSYIDNYEILKNLK